MKSYPIASVSVPVSAATLGHDQKTGVPGLVIKTLVATGILTLTRCTPIDLMQPTI